MYYRVKTKWVSNGREVNETSEGLRTPQSAEKVAQGHAMSGARSVEVLAVPETVQDIVDELRALHRWLDVAVKDANGPAVGDMFRAMGALSTAIEMMTEGGAE